MINLHFGIDRLGIASFVFIIGLTGSLQSCKETATINMDHLYGRWEIARADRNGKETSYLRNGYFIVYDNGTMTINITGEDESGNFIFEGNKLNMEGDKSFDIVTLQPDSMVVQYQTTSNSLFTFFMVKDHEAAQ